MIKNELKIFFATVSYYTRIPVYKLVPYTPFFLNETTRYFPVIGCIVGTFSFFIFSFSSYVFSLPIDIVLSMVGSVLLTGAFHEDGFADVCDGFGGGWTKDKILEIMKDSRLGTYGVIGLIFILSLKFLALQLLLDFTEKRTAICLLLFIVPHTISRFTAISLIYTYKYVGRSEGSKAKSVAEKPDIRNLLIAAFFGCLPLILLIIITNKASLLLVLLPVYLLRLFTGKYFNYWIGGYTGDCLGAVQQLSELICYLSLIVLWKFF